MSLFTIILPASASTLVHDGIKTIVVEATDSAAALVLAKAARSNDKDSVWDNATITELPQDLVGVAFTVAADTTPALSVTYTAVADDTWEEVAAGLVTLLIAEGYTASWLKDTTQGNWGTLTIGLGNANITGISAAIVSGGHGYEALDTLTLSDGTVDPTDLTKATIRVDTVTDDGVATATLTEGGVYTVASDGVAEPVTGGGGSDANFTLTWGFQMGFLGLDVTAVLAAGGTGYTVNDVLTLVGGTSTTVATLKVTSVNSGVVDGIEVLEPGEYTVKPGDAIGVTGGTGGDDFTLTGTAQWRGTVLTLDAVAAAGNGYKDAEEVTLVGGAGSEDAVVTVTTAVNGIITVAVLKAATDGDYTAVPANPVSVTGGSGSDATFTMVFDPHDNVGDKAITATVADAAGNDVSTENFANEVESGVATVSLTIDILAGGSSERVIGEYK